MSQIDPRTSYVGGTQSPPPDDCHPMGVCSIEGGNAGGIPDRQQRSQYFDPSEHVQEQTQAQGTPLSATSPRVGQDGQQTTPRVSGPFKK
ncbi:hypothetical protein DFH94DRAFT_762694 [Russula ochroleuca]|uniref:Uncharacterized protein n=1 Tax=Russula ochroleuca TaxID=152965 RepID=A0A9P5MRD8_9AGAM|nr:hypothetical protein DFH94DRAFT_762694 [Russula ochroleuca]